MNFDIFLSTTVVQFSISISLCRPSYILLINMNRTYMREYVRKTFSSCYAKNTKEYPKRSNWLKFLRILSKKKTMRFCCLSINSIIYVRNLRPEAEELRIQRMTNSHCLFVIFFLFFLFLFYFLNRILSLVTLDKEKKVEEKKRNRRAGRQNAWIGQYNCTDCATICYIYICWFNSIQYHQFSA